MPKYLEVHGDEEVKRSITGVTVIFGGHPLDAASATQSLVALSGAEAEFYVCNRRTAGGLQTCHFLTEAGCDVIPRVWSDSSAAAGSFAGQAQTGPDATHADTGTAAERGVLLLKSAPTNEMTKHLAASRAAADHFDVRTDRVATVSFTNAARAASPRAAAAMEEATHTSWSALCPGTAAVVKISAGLDCEAVSSLGSL